MTIVNICTLALNAVIAVLLVGYGVWLRNIFTQQLSAKDTTIETLNAAIKLHEGEVAALKGDRAPAIAAEHETMREFAEQMTAEKQKLEAQLKETTAQKQEGRELQFAHGKAEGLLISTRIILGRINVLRETSQRIPLMTFGSQMMIAIQDINTAIETTTQEVLLLKKG